MRSPDSGPYTNAPMEPSDVSQEEMIALAALEPRLGRLHLRQRLGLERDYESHIFRRGTHFLHIENWVSLHALIRGCLRLAGLNGRAQRNALAIDVRRNEVLLADLPQVFEGFTLLHLSDLHVDMSERFVPALVERVRSLDYDLCVLTGDYRARTFGPFEATLAASNACARICVGPCTPCSEITTPFAWCPGWRRWGTACCSTSQCGSNARERPSTSPASTMHTITGWRISIKRRMAFRNRKFRSCCRTRPRPTGAPHIPTSG